MRLLTIFFHGLENIQLKKSQWELGENSAQSPLLSFRSISCLTLMVTENLQITEGIQILLSQKTTENK